MAIRKDLNCDCAFEYKGKRTRWECILEVEPAGKYLEGGGTAFAVRLRLWTGDTVSRSRKWKH